MNIATSSRLNCESVIHVNSSLAIIISQVIMVALCNTAVESTLSFVLSIFMAALCNRAGHYIFALWFLSIFYPLFSSPNPSGHRLDVYLPYFCPWRGPSANLECRSEMCCTRLAGNAGPKKVAKNRHLGTIAQLCRAISSQLRHISTIGKKAFKQRYLLHMFSQYGELQPTSG